MDRLVFRVKGWIDKEEFNQLLLFSDYLGRIGNEAVFVINEEKMHKHDISFEEVVEKLEVFGERITKESIQVLMKKINEINEKNTKKIEISLDSGFRISIKPNFFMGELFKELKDKGLLYYNRNSKQLYTYPGVLHQLIDELEKQSIMIIDKHGLLNDTPLNTDIEFTGKLRDYQIEAIDAWRKNRHRGIIALPTGSGKTIIGIYALALLSVPTLIVTFTKEQLKQWIEKTRQYTNIPGGMVAPYYGEEKRLAPITVTTYQTAFRRIDLFYNRFNFLIVDEVHHLPAEKFKEIALKILSKYRMGLSATVVREDGKHVELFPLMGGIVFFKTPYELVDKGYLAPYVTKIIRVEMKPQEKKAYEELRSKYKQLSQGLTFSELLKRARKGDFRAINALRIHNRMKQLMHKTRSKIDVVKQIVEDELSKGSKILVFTQYVDQATEIGKILNAPVLTGNIDSRTRTRILNEFRDSKTGVLVLTTVGDEGLDLPDVNVGIVVAGTGSRRQFIQRLGRLLRPKPGKTAYLYEIITKHTSEEYQARRRKKIGLDELVLSDEPRSGNNENS